jgi:hypothetical protein
MAQLITLNSGNFVVGSDNKMVLTLAGGADLRGLQVSLQSAAIPYSWFNVTARRGNNSFSYLWNGAPFVITIPDGFYSVSQLSEFMQFEMFDNGHYLLDDNAEPVYFLSLAVNPVYYRVTLTATQVPSVLPVGWTNPTAITLNDLCPQLQVADVLFGALIGFSVGTYPAAQTTTTSLNGDLVPNVTVYSSISIETNMVNNKIQNNRTIFNFVPTGSFGNYITVEPRSPVKFDVIARNYTTIEVEFRDQLGAPLIMNDKDVTVALLLTPAPVGVATVNA